MVRPDLLLDRVKAIFLMQPAFLLSNSYRRIFSSINVCVIIIIYIIFYEFYFDYFYYCCYCIVLCMLYCIVLCCVVLYCIVALRVMVKIRVIHKRDIALPGLDLSREQPWHQSHLIQTAFPMK